MTLEELRAALGPEATDALVRRWGGRRIYVRHPGQPPAAVDRALGPAASEALRRAAGGGQLDVPSSEALRMLEARAKARRMLARGASVRAAAAASGLSRRTAGRIRRGMDGA